MKTLLITIFLRYLAMIKGTFFVKTSKYICNELQWEDTVKIVDGYIEDKSRLFKEEYREPVLQKIIDEGIQISTYGSIYYPIRFERTFASEEEAMWFDIK